MIIEIFQRADNMWSFRRIALLGVQEDPGMYPSREAALAAARATYPGETVSEVDSTMDTPPQPHSD
ncbi:hypothetical protein D3C87_778620 [compost metagenome]|uniref:hypothetical protein n=1 Tax=Achromobacter sp. Root83 TaxID=1736602 RepID=UPI00070EB48C|nr:hypothetical protein [Achromobacter sp. Root83]KRC68209.1 hypothetical protein ASE30_20390 [Achromobacter sp. Root83]